MKEKKNPKRIVLIAAAVLVVVLFLNIWRVFRFTSDLTRDAGRYHLESVSGDFESTIDDAQRLAMSLGIQAHPYLGDPKKIKDFVYSKKAEILKDVDGCFNVYMAGTGWAIIPDFDMPDDYVATKRDWYRGAKRDRTYVSAPYVDAMTKDICFTVSVLLGDSDTVLAMDYTMETIQSHITQTYGDGSRYAVIVTGDGIIAGCSDEQLIGKQLAYELPEFSGILGQVKARGGFVSTRMRSGLHYENLFATSSGFGWYLIVSENDWDLYKDSYLQFLGSIAIVVMLTALITGLFLVTERRERAMHLKVKERDATLAQIADQLTDPLATLLEADRGQEPTSQEDLEANLALVQTAGRQILDAVQGIQAMSQAPEEDDHKEANKETDRRLNARFRTRILFLICLVVVVSSVSNVWMSLRWGTEAIQSSVDVYDYMVSEWVSQQKSILDMFCSVVSTNPKMLDDYDGMVAYLDRITRQYPEISVTYMTNPDRNPTVYMNNGWLPPKDWHVEERQWYIDTINSETGWSISAPYYDEQTGLYCVTFAERVYDAETGEFLGNFGIDFFMDKLIDILGGSYTDKGYAFLTDSEGVIINHPYGSYQMAEGNTTNVSDLNYGQVKADGRSSVIVRDYDGALRIITAKNNAQSRFTVYRPVDFLSVYGFTLLSVGLVLAVLVICAIMVYRQLTALMRWQDDMNVRMREAADAAIAAGHAKSRFLAQMSHEIRTPINAVLGMNEMILRESDDPSILDYASNIKTSGRTLLSLINGVLDFSKIEEGKMEIVPVEYDATSFINNLVVSISERARGKGLELRVEVDPELPSRMVGDDVRLSQVIMNLLTNAVKYTEKGFVRLSIHGENQQDGSIMLAVEVEDSGIGIRDKDLPRLFESFERLDEVRNHSIEGTGLGMSIVTRLLDMMGGHLEVKSTYGKGSVFSFVVSQEIADATPIGDYSKRLSASQQSVASETLWAADARILVVDDNEMNLKVAKNLLKLFGIVPDLVESGFAAIDYVRDRTYHIVFLDHMMPKMDGVQTLERMRNEGLLPEETKAIVQTANAVNGARERYLAAGFDDYLSKPIDVSKLEALLVRWLPESLCTSREPAPTSDPGTSETDAARPETGQGDSGLASGDLVARLGAAGLDTQAGLRYAAGDKDFYIELASSFAEGETRNLSLIRRDLDERDWHDYQIRVHALKSTARQIGANDLSDMAFEQELAAKAEDVSQIEEGADALLERYERTAEDLRRLLALDERPDETPQDDAEELRPTISAHELRERLQEARALMDDFEAERAADVLRPLCDLTCDGLELREALEGVVDALDAFDTITAEEGLDALLEQLAYEGDAQ